MKKRIEAPLREFKRYPNSFRLYSEDHSNATFRSLHKYMDLETAIICLRNKSIRFVQPSEWPDNYEKHFYNAIYTNITNDKTITPKFWACCLTINKMCEASWNTYRYGKQGIGCRCVKFQLNRVKFRNMLRSDHRIKNTYEGFMNYNFTDYQIQSIHRKSSEFYQTIFADNFGLNWYFFLMLIKRSAFNYENEFRFMLTSDAIDEQTKAIYINIDWSSIIEAVEVDKDCTETEIEILKKYLQEAGVKESIINKIKKVTLYEDPNNQIIIE